MRGLEGLDGTYGTRPSVAMAEGRDRIPSEIVSAIMTVAVSLNSIQWMVFYRGGVALIPHCLSSSASVSVSIQ